MLKKYEQQYKKTRQIYQLFLYGKIKNPIFYIATYEYLSREMKNTFKECEKMIKGD